MKKLESDAEKVLSFMASNGLVANPKKTSFVILNQKGRKDELIQLESVMKLFTKKNQQSY